MTRKGLCLDSSVFPHTCAPDFENQSDSSEAQSWRLNTYQMTRVFFVWLFLFFCKHQQEVLFFPLCMLILLVRQVAMNKKTNISDTKSPYPWCSGALSRTYDQNQMSYMLHYMWKGNECELFSVDSFIWNIASAGLRILYRVTKSSILDHRDWLVMNSIML